MTAHTQSHFLGRTGNLRPGIALTKEQGLRRLCRLPSVAAHLSQTGSEQLSRLPGLVLDLPQALPTHSTVAVEQSLPGSVASTSGAEEATHTFLNSIYALAVAAASPAVQVSQRQDAGWLAPISNALEYGLSNIQAGLDQLHVPYSYGWSIILLTLSTKVLTFPFTKIQVESAISVQKLKPTIDAIKRQYGDDKEKIQRETSALYEKSGVNPLAGCAPTLATIPIFWGLYRTLSNVASDGLLTEGFYWIPSLSGPITVAQQRAGNGSNWLFPFLDGHPPIGWDSAARYLVLPVLLVLLQFVSTAIISPPVQQEDKEKNNITQKALSIGLPFMVGWFALNLPAGLSLYYFSNITLTSAQQIWLRKLGGAKAFEWKQDIGINQARRTGQAAVLAASSSEPSSEEAVSASVAAAGQSERNGSRSAAEQTTGLLEKEAELRRVLSRRCKRKKKELVAG